MQSAAPDFDLSNWQISDARFDLVEIRIESKIEIKIEIRIEIKAEQAEQPEQPEQTAFSVAVVHAGAQQLQTLTRRPKWPDVDVLTVDHSHLGSVSRLQSGIPHSSAD
ncbi:hypothetical protein MOSE0_A04434 [Monosporozyma servazzii]